MSGEPVHRTSQATVRLDEEESDATRAFARREELRPALVVLTGLEVGMRVRLRGTVVIGRDPACDVVLTDPSVSTRHARIEDRGGVYAVVDLGSTNGTRVNGKKVFEAELAPGDKIAFGKTQLRFEVHDAVEQEYDEAVERLMNVDDLTGLFVRRKFETELRLLLERALLDGRPVGLLVMDLDGVKAINDRHGHQCGGRVIAEVGELLGGLLVGRGIGARFGGDEFLAALPGYDLAATVVVGNEICRSIGARDFLHERAVLRVRVSIGAAAWPSSAKTPESLFACADEAMYRAKLGGGHRVSV